MPILSGVPARAGIFLSVDHDGTALKGTVMRSKQGGVLSPVYDGPVGQALSRAQQASAAAGFEGYFEIEGGDEISTVTPKEYAEATAEIARQTSALLPTAGFAFGHQFAPPVPLAQAQVSRLSSLEKALRRATVLPAG
jgi:hypothetical protein